MEPRIRDKSQERTDRAWLPTPPTARPDVAPDRRRLIGSGLVRSGFRLELGLDPSEALVDLC